MINKLLYAQDNMNYKKIYDLLCSRGQTVRSLDYIEKHHIIPKCLGGNDSEENLTRLTAREHYIAHWLLHKIYKKIGKFLMHFFGWQPKMV
jgi:5-methylcytosine-specific restriction endonuclease McrA